MIRQSVLKSAAIAIAFFASMSAAGIASAQGMDPEEAASMRAAQAQAQAMKAQAAKARAMQAQAAKMKMMQAQQAQAAQGMALAAATASMAAAGAGECSPYLAKWMMSRNPAWKVAYDLCMDD